MAIGHFLKRSLSQDEFTVVVDVLYPLGGSMELHYDSGAGFSQKQEVVATVKKERNTIRFPFQLKGNEQLRHVRLDFGSNRDLRKVTINSVALSNGDKTLFRLEKKEIAHKIGLLAGIYEVDKANATLTLGTDRQPFDPYIVFDPVNELIYPKWQRTLLLVLPWLVLFFFPVLGWLKRLMDEREYGLLFIGLFVLAIPLKIAWVTFTTLLLLAYALFDLYKKRHIRFGPNHITLLVFFAVSLLFLGKGDFSKLAIPLGFVLFALIGAIVDFSDRADRIKKIYVMVFFVVISITTVSWLLLIGYDGYYYKINMYNYFTDIKTHAHATTFWLYYPHTTFLSFFMLIGGVFCNDLYEKGQVSRTYLFFYAILGLCALLLLGSRFALLTGVALPFLFKISTKNLSGWLVSIWAMVFGGIVYFIGDLDAQRQQLWKMSWVAFKEKIWFGHGTGTSGTVLPDHLVVNKAGTDTLLEVNHSHNQFLTYLLEDGLLGTLLFLTAFFFIVYQFAKQGNKTMVLVSFMILLLMIIESPFKTTTPLYVISFLLSVFSIGDKRVQRSPDRDHGK